MNHIKTQMCIRDRSIMRPPDFVLHGGNSMPQFTMKFPAAMGRIVSVLLCCVLLLLPVPRCV